MKRIAVRAALLAPAVSAMGLVILASNILVQYPLDYIVPVAGGIDLKDILTWGAFSYPVAFLVTDTTNRLFGPESARRIVYAGFAFGVFLSLVFADPRIAMASGTAFLVAQLMDIHVFNRFRRLAWWKAPLISTLAGSSFDTLLFFSIAFAGTGLPWHSWALGDFTAKLVMAGVLLPVFRLIVAWYPKSLRGQPEREIEAEAA